MSKSIVITDEKVISKIYLIRGKKVMMDRDLAEMYGVKTNIGIIRVFTRMRQMLFTHKDIVLKLEQLEKQVLKQDGQLKKHEREMQMIFTALKELLNPKTETLRKIGFKHTKED